MLFENSINYFKKIRMYQVLIVISVLKQSYFMVQFTLTKSLSVCLRIHRSNKHFDVVNSFSVQVA